jgi:hypothetical protein
MSVRHAHDYPDFGPEPMTPERAAHLRGFAEGAASRVHFDPALDADDRDTYERQQVALRAAHPEDDGLRTGMVSSDDDQHDIPPMPPPEPPSEEDLAEWRRRGIIRLHDSDATG